MPDDVLQVPAFEFSNLQWRNLNAYGYKGISLGRPVIRICPITLRVHNRARPSAKGWS